MIYVSRHFIEGLTYPFLMQDRHGKFFFTEEELIADWHRADWERLDLRLRIEKIDNIVLVGNPIEINRTL